MQIVREVPKDLPSAVIYLDDLERIEQIVASAIKESGRNETPIFQYEIDEGSSSALFSNIEDLKKHEGKTSKLSMNVRLDDAIWRGDRILWLYGRYSRPTFSSPYMVNKNLQWSAFCQVESIFKSRQLKLRTLRDALPRFSAFYAWLPLAIPVVISIVNRRSTLQWWPFWIPFIAYSALDVYAISSSSKVVLSYSRSEKNTRRTNRKDTFNKVWIGILIALVGAVAGALLTHRFGSAH